MPNTEGMEAKALFDAGKLSQAIEAVTRQVKSNPGDPARRTFLFELLCFVGEWERAEKQLDVIGHQSPQAELGVQVYRNNINAERERRRVFAEGVQPHFLNEPPPYVDHLIKAINQLGEGDSSGARKSLDLAEEERPALSGKMNGQPFKDFRDYDDNVGPVLELIVKDKYAWLPFAQIKGFKVSAPRQLRDLLWAQVRIEALDGTIGEVYAPTLYSGSSQSTDDRVRLGRLTEWKQLSDELYRAVGLRLFLVDDEDKTLFEATVVEFDVVGNEISDQTQAVPS